MSDKRRLEAADSVEPVVHYLLKLQAEGWAVARVEHLIEYKHHLPVGATLEIKLRPKGG